MARWADWPINELDLTARHHGDDPRMRIVLCGHRRPMRRWTTTRGNPDALDALLRDLLAVPIEKLPPAAMDGWLTACADCLASSTGAMRDSAVDAWYGRLVRARLDHPTIAYCRRMAWLVAHSPFRRGARRRDPAGHYGAVA